MVEKARRTGGESASRAADGRRFEVFIREEETDPLHHVGTVAAPTPDDAHDEASRLFAWYARDVWICPAEETHRYSTASLAAAESAADEEAAAGETTESVDSADSANSANSANSAEPRVYEETEGSPEVTAGGPSSSEGGETGENEERESER